MHAILIEIQRGADWNKVTTISVPRFANDHDGHRAKQAAMQDATRQLGSWQDYFAGNRLRLREVA